MDHRALYATQGEPTVGGLVAANVSGPRRISAGAARDALIGLRFVNGAGEILKSGGRVMKNVTGLDLVKLICGAPGTLGLVTEATFKLVPEPEWEASLVIRRLDDARAIEALSRALGFALRRQRRRASRPAWAANSRAGFLRVEGVRDSVAYRIGALLELLKPFGAKHALEGEDSARLWREVGDAAFLAAPADAAVWRVSLAPSRAAAFVAAAGGHAQAHFYDWGGGLVWLSSAATEAAAAAIRAALAPFGGHATLVRAPDALRAAIAVFEPPTAPLAAIARGVKTSFDPDGLFNAGRMYRGM